MIRYNTETYNGRKNRKGVQIVATDDTGTRRKVFTIQGQYRTYKSSCLKLWEGAAHYKSGLNRHDAAELSSAFENAKKLAKKMNETQDPTLRG